MYAEFHPRPELDQVVACTWERVAGDATGLVLPDGCVDIVWREGVLEIAGPDTEAKAVALRPGEEIAGIRLRPGVAGPVLGLPAIELRDARVPLEDVWGRAGAALARRVGSAPRSDQRVILEDALLARMRVAPEPDVTVLSGARLLGLAGSRVGSLSRAVGMGERQLLRRFQAAVGYGPKTLDRVIRLQRFLALAPSVSSGEVGLARVAAELGYADQAHLTRECVRLSGLTPLRLLERWATRRSG